MISLWLILKIIGYILLGILSILLGILCIIIFFPIDYRVYYEKYTDSMLQAKVRLFYIIGIQYAYEKDKNILLIKFCGIPIKKLDLTDEEVEEEIKGETEEKKEAEENDNTTKRMKEDMPSVHLDTMKSKAVTDGPQETISPAKSKKVKKPQKDSNSIKKPQKASWLEIIKRLWESPYRDSFLKAVWKLVKDIFKQFKPHTLYFKVVLGKDDPSETGQLIAKLTMLYPLIYRYGVIDGDYTKEGLWGDVTVGGRLRIFNLVKVLLSFIFNKEARNYIKIILNVRKVEENGI